MRFPFITPGTSKKTIYNGLVMKKIVEQNSVLAWSVGGATDDVTANHVGQTPVISASIVEGTIYDPPKNRVKILDAVTKDTLEYNPGTGAREIFGRLTYLVASWLLDYYYIDDAGAEINVDPTAITIPGFSGDIDYWYAIRTNLRDVSEDWAVSDIRELPIDMDKYAPDLIVATDGTGNYTTITAAIAACPSGGTIFVKTGDYTGEGIIGINQAVKIVLSYSAFVQQFTVNVDNVAIEGGGITTININGARNYIKIQDTITTSLSGITLIYSEVSGNRFSTVSLSALSNSLFVGNDVSGTTDIVSLFTQSRMSENRFAGTVTIASLVASVIQCNTYFSAAGLAITNMQASGCVIEENTCAAITIGWINAIAGTLCLLSGNSVSGNITVATIDNPIVIIGNKANSIVLGDMYSNVRCIGNEATVSLTTYWSGKGYFAYNGAVTLPAPVNHNLISVFNNVMNSFPVYASDPASPVTGDTWFNSTSGQWKGYNGTAVVIIG